MDTQAPCPNCGYDLQSLGGCSAALCPECGQVPRWRPAHAAFCPSRTSALALLATILALPLSAIIARPAGASEAALFLGAFVWSWASIALALAAGYWRSGRLPAIVHGIIVGGVLAAIWASVCFLLVEQVAHLH